MLSFTTHHVGCMKNGEAFVCGCGNGAISFFSHAEPDSYHFLVYCQCGRVYRVGEDLKYTGVSSESD